MRSGPTEHRPAQSKLSYDRRIDPRLVDAVAMGSWCCGFRTWKRALGSLGRMELRAQQVATGSGLGCRRSELRVARVRDDPKVPSGKYRSQAGFSLGGRPGPRRLDPPGPWPAGAHSGSRRASSDHSYKSAASQRGGRLGRRRGERGLVGGWAWLLTDESCAMRLGS
jgi:hypothetical protein